MPSQQHKLKLEEAAATYVVLPYSRHGTRITTGVVGEVRYSAIAAIDAAHHQ